MNSNYGRSTQSGSLNNFDFDFGINLNRSKPLNAQKNNTYTQPKPNSTTMPFWQSNKPSWTHQPAARTQSGGSLNGPTSMVGDITGRSWASLGPQSSSGIGIANRNPNLFSDLVGSNLGVGKGNSGGNVPLKNAASVSSQTASKSVYAMGGMADSLPKSSSGVNGGGGGWGSSQGFGGFNASGYGSKSQNLGGPSMKSSTLNGVGSGVNSNKDPFGSLVDFSSKPVAGMKQQQKQQSYKANPTNSKAATTSGDDVFGTFQNALNASANAFACKTSFTGSGIGSQSKGDDFGFVGMQSQPTAQSSGGSFFQSKTSSMGSQTKTDDFGFGGVQNQPPVQSSGGNDFDMLFTSPSAGNASKGSETFVNQQFAGAEDWGFESDVGGGGGDVGGTTELEGLPPPPAGVTSSSAKSKGMDNYKAGQYPDAIKWLSWAVILLDKAGDNAVILLDKAGDNAGTTEVLSSRASCYKEVGEYKKAVADCSKVLEQDGKNVAVLVQRALLYESMEKYKLGAEDLRTVMNIDPGNRVARSTIHRFTKLAG